MKKYYLIKPLLTGLIAGFIAAGASHAQIPESVTFSDVWTASLPETTADPITLPAGQHQLRAFAVNNNPGSAWLGTMYVTRRNVATTNPDAAPSDIFFWKGTSGAGGTLKLAGPNATQPDGRFMTEANRATLLAAGYDTTGGNSWWAIGVADDDYVYVAGLTASKLVRFNPDGTNPVIVSTDFPRMRQFYVTGRGANTTIWYIRDTGTPIQAEKAVASAVDGTGAPTAFTRSVLFSTDGGSQWHQSVIDSKRTNFYFTLFAATARTSVRRWEQTGAAWTETPGFPATDVSNASGIDIDPDDRILVVGDPIPTAGIYAMNPLTGANITMGDVYVPANLLNDYQHYIEIARFSARHYFYFANDAWGTGISTAPFSADFGVIATDVPAPAPKNIVVGNPGTGNTLNISFELPDDPEVKGVNVYRSTTAGTLGSQVGSNVTASPYSATGLTAGTTYYFTIRSAAVDPFTNASYESANTNQVTGTPQVIGPPTVPTGVTATNTGKGGEVRIDWTTPAANVDYVNIYRSTTAGTLGERVRREVMPTKGAAASWLDTGLTNGTTYYYTVRGENGAGVETTNTEQVSAAPTDTTAPTFAGIKSIRDLGQPGLRLGWDAAVDNSAVTYNIFVGSSPSTINYASPVATTTATTFDLGGLPLGKLAVIAVRAKDAGGNSDANTATLAAIPNRVIVDSDKNGGVNFAKFNPQPDTNAPALLPVPIGTAKENPPSGDLVVSGFAEGVFYYQTNDKLGKSSYELTIPSTGVYDLSTVWATSTNINTPNYTFHITYPDNTTEDVTVDQIGASGNVWTPLNARKLLTAGTLKVVGDATTTSNPGDVLSWNVSGAVRALLLAPPIYRAATAPTIDGNITAAEWAGARAMSLGAVGQDLINPSIWTGPSDYSANVFVKWDATALYIAADVTDDTVQIIGSVADNAIFNQDSLEIYLGLDPAADPTRTFYMTGDYQIVLSGSGAGPTYTGKWFSPQIGSMTGTTNNVVMKKTATGYTLEARIPWSALENLPGIPTQDQLIGLLLMGNDNDSGTPGQESALSMTGKGNAYMDPQAWATSALLGTPPAVAPGDVDMSGTVDIQDARIAAQIASGLRNADSSLSFSAADINGDGKVTLEDAEAINRKANGL